VAEKHCGEGYWKESISTLPKKEYLKFLEQMTTETVL